jgi:hypothetical protein
LIANLLVECRIGKYADEFLTNVILTVSEVAELSLAELKEDLGLPPLPAKRLFAAAKELAEKIAREREAALRESEEDARAKALGAVFKIEGPVEHLTGYFVEHGETHDGKPQYIQLDMPKGTPYNGYCMEVYFAAGHEGRTGWPLFYGYKRNTIYKVDSTTDTPPCSGWTLDWRFIDNGGINRDDDPLLPHSTLTITFLEQQQQQQVQQQQQQQLERRADRLVTEREERGQV